MSKIRWTLDEVVFVTSVKMYPLNGEYGSDVVAFGKCRPDCKI